MWPMDRPPPPQGLVHRPRPPGMRHLPTSRFRAGPPVSQPQPQPQLPTSFPAEDHWIEVVPETLANRPKKPSKGAGGILGWIGSGHARRNQRKQKEYEVEPNIGAANASPAIPPWRTNTGVSRPKSVMTSSSRSIAVSDESRTGDQPEPAYSIEELSAHQEARQRELIVVCKPSSPSSMHYQPVRGQTVPFLEKPIAAPKRLDIGSARVYLESPWTFKSSLELIRRSKATPPTQLQSAQSERAHLTWL